MAQVDKITIIQGDSSNPYNVGIEGVTILTGYTCKIDVQDASGATTGLARTITTKTTIDGVEYFVVQLNPSETASLSVGHYTWGIQLSNDVLPYKREVHIAVAIIKQVVT